MKKTEMMYEGKAKKVWATDDPDCVIVEYKDDATAFNGLKKGTIAGKGVVNNKVSNRLFKYLEENGVDYQYFECPHSGHGLQNDNSVYRRWMETVEAYLDKYMPAARGGKR